MAVIHLRANVPIRSLGRNLHRNWYDLLEVLIVSRLCSLQIVQHGKKVESREMKINACSCGRFEKRKVIFNMQYATVYGSTPDKSAHRTTIEWK